MMMNKRAINLFWGLLTGLLILGVLALTLWGNSNNLNPRYLFIDEQITFYPIIKILNPSGIDEFLWLVSDGSDYRYGRILWNALALAALIPTKLFGESGQIIASREAGTVFLLLAYLLLTHTFIERPAIRFAALLTLIVLPYNSYYMSMPKPEPIMLLCAALFLFFYKKNNLTLGKPYWIFLGMAFGAKISFLLPMIVFLGAAITLEFNKKTIPFILSESVISVTYLVIGFVIANPYFAPAFLTGTFIVLWILLISRLIQKSYSLTIVIVFAILSCALLEPVFREYVFGELLDLSGTRHALSEWIRGTFLKINDGENAHTQNFLSWGTYLLKIIFPNNLYLAGIYIVGVVIFFFSNALKNGPQLKNKPYTLLISCLLTMIAAIQLISPMLSVKNRLWGMYLFPGLVFMQISSYSLLNNIADTCKPPPYRKHFFTKAMLFFILVLVLCVWLPTFICDFAYLATRDIGNNHNQLLPRLVGI